MVEQPVPGTKSRPKGVISKLTRTPDEYIKDRVEYKINNYTKKAVRYRWAYQAAASLAAIGSAAVPVLINIPGVNSLIPTLLGLFVAALVALEGVWHLAAHWRNYDLISSVLREEEMRFSTKASPYDKKGEGEDKVFSTFVDRVEDAMAKERAETIVMRTTSPSKGKGPGTEGGTATGTGTEGNPG
jgi:hypothetical protein